MKLRTRFALFSAGLIALVVIGTSYATLHFLKSLVLKEIANNQANMVENLRKVCEEAQISKDDIFAYNYLSSLTKTVKGVSYAVFVDTQRQLVLGKSEVFDSLMGNHDQVLRSAMSSKPVESYALPNGRRILSYAAPIVFLQGRVGSAYLGFYEDVVAESVNESVTQIKKIIVAVALAAFIIGISMSVLFAVQLTRPILKLTEGAQALGDGNLDTQIEISRKDEIGFLATEFNIMAAKLKELDQLKDAFVSSVSHELRSPLTAISGYVELLTMKPVNELNPEKTAKALNIIRESTTRLTQFVNDILDAAKIKAGKMEIHKSAFDARETMESVFGLFQPLFHKKKMEAFLEVDENVPVIAADEEKVRQVITNLLSNAYKFTPEGGSIVLRAAISVDEEAKEWVVCSVQDNGCGIPKEHQHLLFGKFQQIPGSKNKSSGAKGTGLGLAIAKGIVEAHGGQIWFESEDGKGTTFYFALPVNSEVGDETVQANKLA